MERLKTLATAQHTKRKRSIADSRMSEIFRIAAPTIRAARCQTSFKRVLVNVPNDRKEIRIALDTFAIEPILKKMPRSAVTKVEPLGIRPQQQSHGRRNRSNRSPSKQMNMVVHQAPCVKNHPRLPKFPKIPEEFKAIGVVFEDDLTPHPSRHNVIYVRFASKPLLPNHCTPFVAR